MEHFITKLLSGKKHKTDLIDNLFKQPQKDKNGDNTVFSHTNPNFFQYLDTLYLPNDKGFIYALVLTDQGSRLMDLEPMKDRKASDIIKALKNIYKRKILKKPKVIITDAGSEFKRDFDHELEIMGIQHKTAQPGRHRSVALVERKNQTIGKIIHKILLQVELSTGKPTSQWVSYAKELVKLINIEIEKRSHDIKTIPLDEQTFTYNPDKKIKMFKVGDHVRVALNNPVDIHGKPLIGSFRSSDIRWNPKVRTVKYILMEPEEPIMYLLDGNVGPLGVETVGYTYNQLLKVSNREKAVDEPILQEDENRFEVKKLLERRKKGRSYEYLVLWKNFSKKHSTWEKRTELIKDLGENYLNRVDKKFDKQEENQN